MNAYVTGSFYEILRPLFANFGIDAILSNKLATDADGCLTGEIEFPQTIGEGKAVAMRSFLGPLGIDPGVCSAYGDDESDIPMLSLVGKAVAVIGDPCLAIEANRRGWETITLTKERACA